MIYIPNWFCLFFPRDSGPDDTKIKNYLPKDKQFLYTKNVWAGTGAAWPEGCWDAGIVAAIPWVVWPEGCWDAGVVWAGTGAVWPQCCWFPGAVVAINGVAWAEGCWDAGEVGAGTGAAWPEGCWDAHVVATEGCWDAGVVGADTDGGSTGCCWAVGLHASLVKAFKDLFLFWWYVLLQLLICCSLSTSTPLSLSHACNYIFWVSPHATGSLPVVKQHHNLFLG